MEHLSSDMEYQNQDQERQVEWRRDKVQELCSKGYSQREISQTLQVGLAHRDISYLRNQSKTNIKKYIDERLPEEYEKCLVQYLYNLKLLTTRGSFAGNIFCS
jgi:hypothetical protein